MDDAYNGQEHRDFQRLPYAVPLSCKICKEETVSKLLAGYTSDISQSGLLCNISQRVEKDDLLWLAFDRSVLDIVTDMENRVFIYQQGIIGKVVRVEPGDSDMYDVGIRFITRQEKNLTNIYPKIHFLKETIEKPNE